MKKKLISGVAIIMSVLFYTAPSYAAVQTLTLINHFNDPLKTTVERNGFIVPDFPLKFTLKPGDQIKTRVFSGSEAYIGMRAEHNEKKSTFFGIDTDMFHGYIGEGIAYSWTGDQHVVVTYCTPEEYRKHGHC